MINKAVLIGNLGADPEVRQTNSGTAVANLRIATSERVRDREGNWSDHTEWHRVVVFGRTAENAGKYLSKGRQVYVEGRIRTRKWTDRDGNDRWSTEILCDTLKFLGSRRDGGGDGGGYDSAGSSYGGDGGGGGGGASSAPSGGGAQGSSGGWDSGGADDDIPF